jgi:membrane associated rhomboid family serine protease
MRRFCPGCPQPLAKFTLKGHPFYGCAEHGILAPASVLADFFKSPELASFCLSKIRTPTEDMRASQRRCPECSRGFFTFTAQTFAGVPIDVCQKCRVFWFDEGEWEAVKQGELHIFAAADSVKKVRAQNWEQRSKSWLEVEDGSFAMTLEESDRVKYTKPVLTFLLLGFSLAATVMARRLPSLLNDWGYWPDHPLWIMSHVSSLFVHADLWHWLSNAIFLFIAGDDVEDETGHFEFIKLFLLSGVAGHLTYSWIASGIPSVGMSGAVAGLMAYYAIRFPHHRINLPKLIVLPGFVRFVKLSFSAQSFVAIYVLQNLVGFWFQANSSSGGGGVNYAAHLGGFAFGALYALSIRRAAN